MAGDCSPTRKSDPPLLVISGPTAAGKSRLALELALRLGGEIISADAFQFYRGLDIGTDKPAEAERRLARHHFVDCLSPDEKADALWFSGEARKVVRRLRRAGRVPVVCGGSGLYIRALLEGFFTLPDPAAVSGARLEVSGLSPGEVARRLGALDPVSDRRIHPNDLYRRRRALEVCLATGRPFSEVLGPGEPLEGRTLHFVLARPRAELDDRIGRRVDRMFARGFVDEVRRLRDQFDFRAPAFAAIGYREIARHLDGAVSLGETVEMVKRRTRQYAKRQLTWFRAEKNVAWLNAGGLD